MVEKTLYVYMIKYKSKWGSKPMWLLKEKESNQNLEAKSNVFIILMVILFAVHCTHHWLNYNWTND